MVCNLKILVRSEPFRLARQQANISQVKLERKTGVPQTYISEWELGKRHLTNEEIDSLWTALGQAEGHYDRPSAAAPTAPAPAPRPKATSWSSSWIPEFSR